MERQNITLSLPKELLTEVKIIAAKRNTSISGLLTRMLERLVEQGDEYERAHRRFRRMMEEGFDLGTHGTITVTREELHER